MSLFINRIVTFNCVSSESIVGSIAAEFVVCWFVFLLTDHFLRLDAPMNNITTSLGQMAELHCYISGNPPPLVRWLKNDAPVTPEARRVSYKQTAYGSRLRIRNLDTTDTGYFQCVGSNSYGSVTSTGILFVKFGQIPAPIQFTHVYEGVLGFTSGR